MTLHFHTPDDAFPVAFIRRREAAMARDEIIQAVEQSHGVSRKDILGRSTIRRHVQARHFVMKEMRARGFSYPDIGRALGRDHTTVVHAVNRRRR